MDLPFYKDAIDVPRNNDFPTDFAIFTKALRTDGPTDRRTDQGTDQQTDRRTDKPSYRDAIAASKNSSLYNNANSTSMENKVLQALNFSNSCFLLRITLPFSLFLYSFLLFFSLPSFFLFLPFFRFLFVFNFSPFLAIFQTFRILRSIATLLP